jgi:hypothetical protein
MMHFTRRFRIADASREELPTKLVNHSWTLCTGFRCGPLLFLNDATCEDGAQEYAVIREATGEQIDSITFSWCTKEEATDHINNLLVREVSGGNTVYGRAELRPHRSGSCNFCA